MEAILAANPAKGSIAAVWATWDQPALGAMQAIEAAGRAGDGIVITGIDANPQALEDLKKGKKKPEAVKGFLRGQVMKQTGGKANPALVGELLEAKLAELLA